MKRLITGFDFEGMLLNALDNIRNAEHTVNSMNVFPVADGDTGTNMRLTIEHGYTKATRNKHLGRYLKEVATGMLLGARGNSGVILSQLFKGMSDELIDKINTMSKEFGAEKAQEEFLSLYPVSSLSETKFPLSYEDYFIVGYMLDNEHDDESLPKKKHARFSLIDLSATDKSDADDDDV